MTYTPLKPDAGPSPAVDAPTIQGNFAVYATAFGKVSGSQKYNHTILNDPNQGDHESVLIDIQALDPGVTQNLAVLYAKKTTSAASPSGQPQLFAQIPQFLPNAYDTIKAPNLGMQLTYNSVNTSGPVYQSFLPGGYILYFGTTTNIGTQISVSPTPTKIITAMATLYNMTTGGAPVSIPTFTQVVSATNFQISTFVSPPAGYVCGWMAIAQQ